MEAKQTENLIDILKELQANAMKMYAQTHGYHWNIEGRMFKQDHAFLLEIYEDVFSSIDPYAENLRKLGVKAPFGLIQLQANSPIKINDSLDLTSHQIFQEVINTNTQFIVRLKDGCDIADAAREQSILNFLADRLNQHEFWQWQLISTSESTLNEAFQI
jgi:starvation-inducible DNA-binding protein